jgi:hypothetical protein
MLFDKSKKLLSENKRLKTRAADVDALVKNYDAQIAALSTQLQQKKIEYVVVRPPDAEDLKEYNRQLAEFVKNPFYLSYFEQLKREIVAEFSGNGKNTPDYYKGQLRLIGKIFTDSRESDAIHGVINEVEAEKAQ